MAEEGSEGANEARTLSPEDETASGREGVRERHPALLRSRVEAGEPFLLVDVREPWQWDAVRLDTARHMPLGSFARESGSLDRTSEIVVYCHHGVRSLAAARYLADRGFRLVWNLSGGIDRYALESDPELRRY